MTTRFNCKSGDGAFLNVVTQLRHNVGVLLHIDAENNHAEADAILADPATADAIASALHVAAAQVRSARGEQVAAGIVDPGTHGRDGTKAMITLFGEGLIIPRHRAEQLHAELGAWLAAHEVEK